MSPAPTPRGIADQALVQSLHAGPVPRDDLMVSNRGNSRRVRLPSPIGDQFTGTAGPAGRSGVSLHDGRHDADAGNRDARSLPGRPRACAQRETGGFALEQLSSRAARPGRLPLVVCETASIGSVAMIDCMARLPFSCVCGPSSQCGSSAVQWRRTPIRPLARHVTEARRTMPTHPPSTTQGRLRRITCGPGMAIAALAGSPCHGRVAAHRRSGLCRWRFGVAVDPRAAMRKDPPLKACAKFHPARRASRGSLQSAIAADSSSGEASSANLRRERPNARKPDQPSTD